MARSKSSQRWIQERLRDPDVEKAQNTGHRSRSSFKLVEIDDKYHIFNDRIQVIVDLGAAPGGWSQVARKRAHKATQILALDILPMQPLQGVEVLQGDFTEQEVCDQALQVLNRNKVDVVVSDMAPNISGIRAADQAKSILLAELALHFSGEVLCIGGDFVVKVFQGEGIDQYVKCFRSAFKKTFFFKPNASRPRSREIYLIGREFTGM